MKRALILGVFALVAALGGQAANAAKMRSRTATVSRGYVDHHVIKLNAGENRIVVSSSDRDNMLVSVLRITKDEAGTLKLSKVKTRVHRLEHRQLLGVEIDETAGGFYLVLVASTEFSQKYQIMTLGQFAGKPFTKKLSK